MDNLHPRRYVFRGHASGVSAHIRRPEDQLLPVQGCSNLPVIGGYHETNLGPNQLGKWVSFDAVSTSARGDYRDPADGVATTTGAIAFDAAPIQTTVLADVRGLVILGRVNVARAAIGLVARSPEGNADPSIRLEGNLLEGVQIDGFRLAITLAEDFYQLHDTREKLVKAHAAGLAPEHQHLLVPLDGSAPPAATFPEANGIVKCTIVRKIAWDGAPHPDASIHGHVVRVPGLGKIYFGELFATRQSRRLTMVRFQLGSNDGGEVAAAEGEPVILPFPPDSSVC
jgi:hypothetical protein